MTSFPSIVPMLGLAGETGQLLSEYKKHLRDGEAHRLFKERVSEELGDLLWYIANVASKFDLTLDEIAAANLAKVKARWATERTEPLCFDATLPEGERLPRRFEVELVDVEGERSPTGPRGLINGVPFGGELTDNAYDPDGYRFHDVFHFAYAAVLGWSPITRALLRRKRKSRPLLDEVEDGGRAAVIEEGVAALAFDYARRHHMLDGVSVLDFQLLRTIKDMTSHLEVKQCTTGEWEQAILQGFEVWRAVLAARGGRIAVDLDAAAHRLSRPGQGRSAAFGPFAVRRTADRDGARHGHRAGMADAEPPFGNTMLSGGLCGAACKPDLRRRSRRAMDDDIGERHAAAEPCPQRLQNGFLGGEPAGQTFDPVGPVADLVEFLLNEAARDQRIARILDPAPHLGDVDQIDPVSDDVHIRRQSPPCRPRLVARRPCGLDARQRDVQAENYDPR